MTVSSSTSRWEYTGDGSTTDFTYNNLIFEDSDLEVYVDGTLQTLSTHYTVTGAGTSGGGEVKFVSAPANNAEIVILRAVTNTQESDYAVGGNLAAETLEGDFDRRTVIDQQQEETFARSLRIPKEDQGSPATEFPAKATRAGKFVKFDASGDVALSSEVDLDEGLLVGTDSGAADAYVVTTPSSLASLTDGQIIAYRPDNAPTGASTQDVDGTGAKTLVRSDGSAIKANSFAANEWLVTMYDATADQWVAINVGVMRALASSTDNALPRFDGTGGDKLQNSAATLDDNDLLISPGGFGFNKGGDIASASPLVIDTDGAFFDVTGTTGFSAMTVAAKRLFVLQFDGALTMTHGASLNLPGGQNITTAAGDLAVCYSTAADTVWVLSYIQGGAMNLQDRVLQRPEIKDYGETVNAIGAIGGGTQDIDQTLGNVVTATVDTSTTTFTFSNPPASGTAGSFTLILTNGGSQTVNWPASVAWAGGSAPSLTAAGVDVLTFVTVDNGTTWYGFSAGLDMQ